jgi:molybdopterin-binding protein
MNRLPAIITAIERGDGIVLAHAALTHTEPTQAKHGDAVFTALMTEALTEEALMNETSRLAPGTPVMLCFQESEVALARALAGELSLSNRQSARITALEHGRLLCRVRLDFRGHRLHSLITESSARRLQLQMGDEVQWLVKANEMLLENA